MLCGAYVPGVLVVIIERVVCSEAAKSGVATRRERTRCSRSISVIAFGVAMSCGAPALGEAADFGSCADVQQYFRKPLPEIVYARVQDLERAVEILRQGAENCETWISERAWFEYATALEQYSRTFPDRSDAARKWAKEAAEAYGQYLRWFLDLSEERRDHLIRQYTDTEKATEAKFREARRTWLRRRIGNVLHSMAASFVRAELHRQALEELDRLFRESIEIFSDEVARQWHKWLRAYPDFRFAKSDAQIQGLIGQYPEYSSAWEAFRDFLDAFLNVNPSVRAQWAPVRQKIEKWLSP
jgi:hypothetical protein